MALPELPAQGQNPWFTPRNNWDLAVKSELEGRLSSAGVSTSSVTALSNSQGAVYPEGSALGVITYSSVQSAATLANAEGKRLWAAGTITTDQTLTVNSDADLGGLTVNYTGTGVAVVIGQTSGISFRRRIVAPRVLAANKVAPGWSSVAGTTGIKFVNLNSCSEIVVPYIQGFETGMLVYGEGTGIAYNNFFIGHLANNKRNQVLNANPSGWSNQNSFFGGRYGHDSIEGVNTPDTRHVLMVAGLANVVNNNTWVNPSLEGNTSEFIVDFAGTVNLFINARWEADTPRVRWQDGTTRSQILWGYQAHQIQETFGTGATTNWIVSSGNSKRFATGAAPVETLGNTGSDSNPIVAHMSASGGRTADPVTAYAGLFSATYSRYKRPADAGPRLEIEYQNGRLYFGNGAQTTLTRYFGSVGTTAIALGGAHLYFAADGTNDIGASGGNRPRNIRASNFVEGGQFTTATRPSMTSTDRGMIFDTTLGIPIWWNGSAWINALGTTV